MTHLFLTVQGWDVIKGQKCMPACLTCLLKLSFGHFSALTLETEKEFDWVGDIHFLNEDIKIVLLGSHGKIQPWIFFL